MGWGSLRFLAVPLGQNTIFHRSKAILNVKLYNDRANGMDASHPVRAEPPDYP